LIRRLLGVVAYLVIATLVLGYLGVGGYRDGFVWLALALPATASLLTWALLRSIDTNRLVWCLTVAIVGVTVAAKLVDIAPESAARLDQRLNHLNLPFFTELAERRRGHGWCRPSCPTVTRIYRAPDVGTTATFGEVSAALVLAHLVPRAADFRLSRDGSARAAGRWFAVAAATSRRPPLIGPQGEVVQPGYRTVTLILSARRR
jgi:hypothetical protein